MTVRGPPDGATTRWERMRLLLLAMKTVDGMTLNEIHRFLGGHFGLKKPTREEYLDDLRDMGFLVLKRTKFYPTQAAVNHFKLRE